MKVVLRLNHDHSKVRAVEAPKVDVEGSVKLLLWYWGRRGFPVRFVENLTHELSGRPDVELSRSLSRQSEGFITDINPQFPNHYVDTYRGFPSAVGALFRVPRQRNELANFAKQMGPEVVFVPMRHTFGPLVLPALRQQGLR